MNTIYGAATSPTLVMTSLTPKMAPSVPSQKLRKSQGVAGGGMNKGGARNVQISASIGGLNTTISAGPRARHDVLGLRNTITSQSLKLTPFTSRHLRPLSKQTHGPAAARQIITRSGMPNQMGGDPSHKHHSLHFQARSNE